MIHILHVLVTLILILKKKTLEKSFENKHKVSAQSDIWTVQWCAWAWDRENYTDFNK